MKLLKSRSVIENVSKEKGEEFVLELIKENGHLTINELAEKTNRSRASVQRLVSNMLNEGVIERRGSRRTGYFVLKSN